MARNGSGTYVLPAGQPVVTGTIISSTTFNTLTSDLATALTQSVCTDGQTPMAANLSMGNNKITNLATATVASDALRKDQALLLDGTQSMAANLNAGSNKITSLTSGTATTDAANLGQVSAVPKHNFIINGDFSVAQRATTYALTSAHTYGSMDRWACSQDTSANGIFNQTANTAGGWSYHAKIGRNNAGTETGNIYFSQSLETVDSKPLAGKTVILSFYAKAGANFSAASSNIIYRLYTGTGTDQSNASMAGGTWTGSATPIDTTQAITTSWVKYSTSVALSSSITQVGVLFLYTPVGTAGADDNLYIANVQLEIAVNGETTASDFRQLSYTENLAKCERYYQKRTISATAYQSAGGALAIATWNGGIQPRTASPTVAQVTNNYQFTEANVTTSTSTYTASNYGGYAYRLSTAAGTCFFSELISISAEL